MDYLKCFYILNLYSSSIGGKSISAPFLYDTKSGLHLETYAFNEALLFDSTSAEEKHYSFRHSEESYETSVCATDESTADKLIGKFLSEGVMQDDKPHHNDDSSKNACLEHLRVCQRGGCFGRSKPILLSKLSKTGNVCTHNHVAQLVHDGHVVLKGKYTSWNNVRKISSEGAKQTDTAIKVDADQPLELEVGGEGRVYWIDGKYGDERRKFYVGLQAGVPALYIKDNRGMNEVVNMSPSKTKGNFDKHKVGKHLTYYWHESPGFTDLVFESGVDHPDGEFKVGTIRLMK